MLYPSMTPSRFVSDLSGIWDFAFDNGKGMEEKWYEKPLAEPLSMPVPSSYNDLTESIINREHYGWVFYQKKISVPSFVKGQRVVLRCDAVTHHARIYLNGELLATHECGFLPFEVELTEKLQPGENLLTVAVSNIIDYTTLPVGGKADMMGGMMGNAGGETEKKPVNHPNFDFFNYAGINRPIRIYTTPKDYISDISVVSEVHGNNAELIYEVETKGEGACLVEAFDREGRKVAECSGTKGVLKIENVHLWQPLKAYLYEIKVTFGEDVYTLPYGVRTVRVDGTRFLINEKPFYFKGMESTKTLSRQAAV